MTEHTRSFKEIDVFNHLQAKEQVINIKNGLICRMCLQKTVYLPHLISTFSRHGTILAFSWSQFEMLLATKTLLFAVLFSPDNPAG